MVYVSEWKETREERASQFLRLFQNKNFTSQTFTEEQKTTIVAVCNKAWDILLDPQKENWAISFFSCFNTLDFSKGNDIIGRFTHLTIKYLIEKKEVVKAFKIFQGIFNGTEQKRFLHDFCRYGSFLEILTACRPLPSEEKKEIENEVYEQAPNIWKEKKKFTDSVEDGLTTFSTYEVSYTLDWLLEKGLLQEAQAFFLLCRDELIEKKLALKTDLVIDLNLKSPKATYSQNYQILAERILSYMKEKASPQELLSFAEEAGNESFVYRSLLDRNDLGASFKNMIQTLEPKKVERFLQEIIKEHYEQKQDFSEGLLQLVSYQDLLPDLQEKFWGFCLEEGGSDIQNLYLHFQGLAGQELEQRIEVLKSVLRNSRAPSDTRSLFFRQFFIEQRMQNETSEKDVVFLELYQERKNLIPDYQMDFVDDWSKILGAILDNLASPTLAQKEWLLSELEGDFQEYLTRLNVFEPTAHFILKGVAAETFQQSFALLQQFHAKFVEEVDKKYMPSQIDQVSDLKSEVKKVLKRILLSVKKTANLKDSYLSLVQTLFSQESESLLKETIELHYEHKQDFSEDLLQLVSYQDLPPILQEKFWAFCLEKAPLDVKKLCGRFPEFAGDQLEQRIEALKRVVKNSKASSSVCSQFFRLFIMGEKCQDDEFSEKAPVLFELYQERKSLIPNYETKVVQDWCSILGPTLHNLASPTLAQKEWLVKELEGDFQEYLIQMNVFKTTVHFILKGVNAETFKDCFAILKQFRSSFLKAVNRKDKIEVATRPGDMTEAGFFKKESSYFLTQSLIPIIQKENLEKCLSALDELSIPRQEALRLYVNVCSGEMNSLNNKYTWFSLWELFTGPFFKGQENPKLVKAFFQELMHRFSSEISTFSFKKVEQRETLKPFSYSAIQGKQYRLALRAAWNYSLGFFLRILVNVVRDYFSSSF